jgi:hypothetical protein
MGNDRMENMAETKLLDYNLEKSCFIVIGDEKSRQKINDKLVIRPLTLCGANMVQEEQSKYLGDQLSGLGLAESADATVKKRRGLVIRSIFEIRTVLEDCSIQVQLVRKLNEQQQVGDQPRQDAHDGHGEEESGATQTADQHDGRKLHHTGHGHHDLRGNRW